MVAIVIGYLELDAVILDSILTSKLFISTFIHSLPVKR
ncbi:hypothetical protein NK6_6015 [Bradyrhizobium diazoefficiens]|uniref:Uncharacterized protein n=1 Tax=Bradyrhizobium diazoefficiens TaxID=1355477 RepID=A0A0E3VVH5_9BRAD|nr:hypothetical protein NK6_6015 [Bradyrhizobium diazoefficiens]